jgi:hypothetical protein
MLWCFGNVWKGSAMDFSLHERQRLAEIERELSDDRRLTAIMAIMESRRGRMWRLLRYVASRVHHLCLAQPNS